MTRSELSLAYIIQPSASCFWLLRHVDCCARFLAEVKAGSNMAARIAMMAMTTSNSIRVKAPLKKSGHTFPEYRTLAKRLLESFICAALTRVKHGFGWTMAESLPRHSL